MNLSIYGSHNASVCYSEKNTFRIIEFERFFRKKNCSFKDDPYTPHPTSDELSLFFSYLKKKINTDVLDTVYFNQIGDREFSILEKQFSIKKFVKKSHHFGHAVCAFYQSPFEKSVIFSYDGGGENSDGSWSSFDVFIGNKSNHEIKFYTTIILNFGKGYAQIAIPIKEIKKESNSLQYPGKLMGLSSYGTIISEWIPAFKDYYLSNKDRQFSWTDDDLKILSKKIGLNLSNDFVSGQTSYDLAATSDYVFNLLFIEEFKRIMIDFKGWDVCLSGGCALNVKTNQTILDMGYNVFIPPNPNDSGLSFGFMMDDFTENQYDLTYNGIEIVDLEKLEKYKKEIPHKNINDDFHQIIDFLKEGKIIGLMIGDSEVGPRALGNRSIICYPSISNMKNILNSKIKFREWYRPFAPVVRLEDVNKYFEFCGESRFMSFCPKIKSEYKNKLLEIVHVDNTCRVQTVTNQQHPFLYSLLSEMEKNFMIPVLLNTSLNIRGKPIITHVENAVEILKTTDIDGMIINNTIFLK